MKQPVLFETHVIRPEIETGELVPLPDFQYIPSAAAWALWESKLKEAPVWGVDLETTGLDPLTDAIRLVQIAAPGCPVLVCDLFRMGAPAPLQSALAHPGVKILQNAKFDLKFLAQAGISLGGQIFDTMLAGQLISNGKSGARHGLNVLVAGYLGQTLSKEERLSNWTETELSEAQLHYAARDAAVLLPLREALIEKLKTAGLVKIAKVEFDCVRAVAEMERAGIRLDLPEWQQLATTTIRRRDELTQTLRQLFGGGLLHEINLDSPTQVQKAFAQRGVSLRNTSRWALAEYSDREDVRLFQEYRKASKLCSSFLDVLPQAIHPRTGRLHPTYEQCGVVSGRFSCHSPNLQQLPREKEFRACFVPEAGNCLVIADYSQIELRVAAELSQDRRMMAAYQQKQDLHTLTASLITQKTLEAVTKADRQASKAVNFGLLYGQGARGLKSYSKQSYGVDMTLEEANLFRERFFQAYRGISNWQRKTARESKRLTETRTFWGRRWLLEGHQPDLPTLLNMPVQGTAADITKLALAKLVSALAGTGARIIGCIHDEILLEAPLETAPQAASILTEMMETAGREVLKEVPVEAESRICRNWAEK